MDRPVICDLRRHASASSFTAGYHATFAAILALVVVFGTGPGAHDLERTQVTLSLAADGSFVLDVANDADWLLLRLEPFAGNPAPVRQEPAVRDRRLAELVPVFVDRLVLFVDGREVRATSAEYLPPSRDAAAEAASLGAYRLRGQLLPEARVLRWFYGIVIDPYPFTVRRPDASSLTEWIDGATWNTPVDLSGQFRAPTLQETIWRYLTLGYVHILPRGLDHILFVLGLFLLSPQLRLLLLQVTAFTVAHTITLALTVYGLVALPARIVEPLIALSIAYVAMENVLTNRLTPWRLALVFAFGLLHGMGFAGVLADLGLPRTDFVTALLSFNTGVELGQLTVLGAAFALTGWARARPWYRPRVLLPASLVIAAVGVYWAIVRVIG